jgi:membrane protease YdiL (CAAX protease family)
MSTTSNPLRRHPIVCFAVLACVLGWNQYALTWAGVMHDPDMTGFGPLLAAVIVAAGQGRAELRRWARSLVHWGASPWLYGLALLAPIVLHIVIVAANTGFGAPLPTSDQLAGWTSLPGTFLAFLVLVGIGEEAGWTAFAAPILLRRHGVLTAWLILAGVRILWHLPLVLTGEMPWTVAILGNAGFQLVVLALMVASRSQWTLAAVWHASLNAVGGGYFFSMVTGADLDRLFLLLALVYALAGLAAYLLLRRAVPGPVAQPGADVPAHDPQAHVSR